MLISNTIFQLKESGLFEEMDYSRAGTRAVQNKPGHLSVPESKEMHKHTHTHTCTHTLTHTHSEGIGQGLQKSAKRAPNGQNGKIL